MELEEGGWEEEEGCLMRFLITESAVRWCIRIGWSLSEQDPGDGHFGWCSGYLEIHSVVHLHPMEYYARCCRSFGLVLSRLHLDEMFEISGSASVSQGNFDTPSYYTCR